MDTWGNQLSGRPEMQITFTEWYPTLFPTADLRWQLMNDDQIALWKGRVYVVDAAAVGMGVVGLSLTPVSGV